MAYTVIRGKLVKTVHAGQVVRRNVNLFRDGPPIPPNKPDKGDKNGSCNRTACQRPGANWFNHSTRRYYCQSCAFMLNDCNRRDAMELYGHELCTKDES